MAHELDRRALFGLTAAAGAALAAPAVLSTSAEAAPDTGDIKKALRAFDKLPGDVAYRINVGRGGKKFTAGQRAGDTLFVGSSVKTFILARYLRDVENGRLALAEQLKVNNAVRALSSPVFLELTGTTPATSVLEAMITHSDNTATDIALRQVGPGRVRTFVENAGLKSVRIATSTRLLFCYLAGAPFGVDEGWAGMKVIASGGKFGPLRSPMNKRETMQGSADDFVSYYEQILAGDLIRTEAMRREFRCISSMPAIFWSVGPENTPIFGKGGSIEWDGFNALCLPGQMLVGGTLPVTFSFVVNWKGKPSTIPGVGDQFASAIRATLAAAAKAFG
jgi:beta-lactamase class A